MLLCIQFCHPVVILYASILYPQRASNPRETVHWKCVLPLPYLINFQFYREINMFKPNDVYARLNQLKFIVLMRDAQHLTQIKTSRS